MQHCGKHGRPASYVHLDRVSLLHAVNFNKKFVLNSLLSTLRGYQKANNLSQRLLAAIMFSCHACSQSLPVATQCEQLLRQSLGMNYI